MFANNKNQIELEQYLRVKKHMSTNDVAMQQEHATEKEYIGTLLQQIKEQQDAYVIWYDRNLLLHNELTHAKSIISSARQTLETHSSSQ